MATFPVRFPGQLKALQDRQNNPVFVIPTAAGTRNPFYKDFIVSGDQLQPTQIDQVRMVARTTRQNAIRMCDRIERMCDTHIATIRQREQDQQLEHVISDPAYQLQYLQNLLLQNGINNPLCDPANVLLHGKRTPARSLYPQNLLDDDEAAKSSYPQDLLDDDETDYDIAELDETPTPGTASSIPTPVPVPSRTTPVSNPVARETPTPTSVAPPVLAPTRSTPVSTPVATPVDADPVSAPITAPAAGNKSKGKERQHKPNGSSSKTVEKRTRENGVPDGSTSKRRKTDIDSDTESDIIALTDAI